MSSVFYFGKIPSRGDFIKSSSAGAVIQQLDTWVTRGMELLLDDPDWKRRYDEAAPITFLFAGTRARHMITGRLVSSRDASQRRYPLLFGTLAPVSDPLPFLVSAPLSLASAWSLLHSLQDTVLQAENPQAELLHVERVDAPIEDPAITSRRLREFAMQTTLADLQQQFGDSEPPPNLRRSILALGILLQPILTQARPEVGKALNCPLPAEPQLAALTAAFWLDLITPFLARANLELAILQTHSPRGPILTLSFGGAQPKVLENIWRQDPHSDYAIDIRDVDWVEDYVGSALHLGKLASYLQHAELSLQRATATFRETFLGL
ncbi:MAG: type VI secretion system-associated protein TagF [Nevskia sp.]|jgi:type VI secretion system protein ImpM|nr:type VI secretion system-associated protein TagF [Nevskia sp.]